jgi:FAD/FMN-containing dehydrogenase
VVALSNRVKDAFDPNGTLNPGRMGPRPDGGEG